MGQQLSLSFELILFFNWLLKHGKSRLRLMIRQAVEADLARTLEHMSDEDYTKVVEHMHADVLDFISFLEQELLSELGKQVPEFGVKGPGEFSGHTANRDLFDERSLWLNMQQVKDLSKKDEVKEELLKKLLLSWKPESNEPVN
jgi:hypothetical protein